MRISDWSSDVCSSDLGICPDHSQFITDRQTGAVPHEGATTMTTHRRLHALALALGLCLATAASAQTVSYNIRPGDVWVDNRLGQINDYGRYHRDPFIDEMHGYYAAPRPLLADLLDQPHWSPDDHDHAPQTPRPRARPGALPCHGRLGADRQLQHPYR